jgi:hypothetical protein
MDLKLKQRCRWAATLSAGGNDLMRSFGESAAMISVRGRRRVLLRFCS